MYALKSDDPPFFPIGTVVSARYRGAYCSAVVEEIDRMVKVKVSFQKSELGTCVISEESLHGSLKPGTVVSAKHPRLGIFCKATVLQIMDKSEYKVVYDDGDRCKLKRSRICAPGARHFRESESLDEFPLLNPEEFGAPVQVTDANRGKSRTNETTETNHGNDNAPNSECEYNVPAVATSSTGNSIQRQPSSSTATSRKTTSKPGKMKRLDTKVRPVEKKDIVPPPQPSTNVRDELELEMSSESNRQSKESRKLKYTYFYVTPKEYKPPKTNVSNSQKRKSFMPKKVIRVRNDKTGLFSGKLKKKWETTLIDLTDSSNEESVNSQVDDNLCKDSTLLSESATASSNSNHDHVPLNEVKCTESSTVQIPEQCESTPEFDYTHKKLRLKGDFSSLTSNGEAAKEVVNFSVSMGESSQSLRPLHVLHKELIDIVIEKKVEIPREPPIGRRFNFIPDLENVTDSSERQRLIKESLTAVVLEYFVTKEKLEKEEKNSSKQKQ